MSARRQVRLRKEFLYRKALEDRERAAADRKQRVRGAVETGNAIPTELRDDARQLKHSADAEDDVTKNPISSIDDEYAMAGVKSPKVVITTSRDPSRKLQVFIKELRLVIPNAIVINRGSTGVPELISACRKNEFSDVIIASETRGVVTSLTVCHLPFGPTARFAVVNATTRHDVGEQGTMSEQVPHLIFDGFQTELGKRVMNVLRFLFPPTTKADSKRVVTCANRGDWISFRHHKFQRDGKNVDLEELGPRFELRLFELRRGGMDEVGEPEFVLRPYMNSAKRRRYL